MAASEEQGHQVAASICGCELCWIVLQTRVVICKASPAFWVCVVWPGSLYIQRADVYEWRALT